MSKVLFLIVVILIVSMYTQYYYKANYDYNILQTYLDNASGNMLYEKYPIVIYDKLVNPKQLLTTLFKYAYATQKSVLIQETNPVMMTSKYTIIYNMISPVVINVLSPKYKNTVKYSSKGDFKVSQAALQELPSDAQYITIKLQKQQVLILPTWWTIQCDSILEAIVIDDVFSKVLKNVS
jgi:hypothetical protein